MKTTKKAPPENFNEYIENHPVIVRRLLKKLRSLIKKAAPGAKEIISYGMPAFHLCGNLVYIAGYKKHIGFYPTSSPIKAFQKELKPYLFSKGAIQFPLDKPLPAALVTKIVKFRVKENLAKQIKKKKKMTSRRG